MARVKVVDIAVGMRSHFPPDFPRFSVLLRVRYVARVGNEMKALFLHSALRTN